MKWNKGFAFFSSKEEQNAAAASLWRDLSHFEGVSGESIRPVSESFPRDVLRH
jgi:hypothetical protein